MHRVVVLLLLTACGASKAPPPKPPVQAPVSVPASSAEREAGAVVARVVAMHKHLSRVEDMRDAVIRGDLDAAREAGRVLSRQLPPESAPEHWRPWLRQVRDSAGRVEDAWELDTAARTTAEIARTCGSCHRAEGQGPRFPQEVVSGAGTGVKAHMQHHARAAEQMWQGLIAADDARWTAAATALAEAELGPDDTAPELDTTVHRLAAYGARVQGIAGRADTYGALLATCARCHTEETP